MDGNILLTERTHTIKIRYSRSDRALIRQLANKYSATAMSILIFYVV